MKHIHKSNTYFRSRIKINVSSWYHDDYYAHFLTASVEVVFGKSAL